MRVPLRSLGLLALTVATAAGCHTAAVQMPQPMSDDPAFSAPREQTADQQVWHALDRLAFGPRPGDVARVRAMGVDAWIEQQLAMPASGSTAVERAVADAFPTTTQPVAALLRDAPRPGQVGAQRVVMDVGAARLARAVASEAQVREVLVDFWLNHFSVFAGKGGPMRQYLAAYERDAIRPHVLGRFRDLLGAVASSPAMLWYLDNWQSVADSTRPTLAPPPRAARRVLARAERGQMGPVAQQFAQRRPRGLNENYARELLELHTLGVDGGYTQQDIIEVARAFTGWTLDQPQSRGAFVFRDFQHDAGEKTVLGVRLAAGRGREDGEQVLDIIARHPATARFIATKLVRRFVSDTPPADVVDRAAEVFRRTDGDLTAVVRTIVRSPEFFSTAAWRAKVKSPFELVASAARALDAAPDTTVRSLQLLTRLGQAPFGHQAPNGWPETGDAWINTGSILDRISFGVAAAGGAMPGGSAHASPAYAAAVSAPSREAQVDAVVRSVLGGWVSPEMRAVLLTGENPLGDRRRAADPLVQLVGLALGSPEFQRR